MRSNLDSADTRHTQENNEEHARRGSNNTNTSQNQDHRHRNTTSNGSATAFSMSQSRERVDTCFVTRGEDDFESHYDTHTGPECFSELAVIVIQPCRPSLVMVHMCRIPHITHTQHCPWDSGDVQNNDFYLTIHNIACKNMNISLTVPAFIQ